MIARQQGIVRCVQSSQIDGTYMHPTQVADLIRAALPGAEVVVESPDQRHFTARIVSTAFAGLGGVARHQLVYAALGERVGHEVHALQIKALTPQEARAPADPTHG
jgi:acid stress-induced BolA-like protein IbaG/YrbA